MESASELNKTVATERELNPDFDKSPDGLLPAVVQDARTARVLMLGYLNAEALAKTLDTGLVTFFSRSRQQLWQKGESSGHVLRLRDIRLDCDRDAFLIKAEPNGPVCHTGAETCWNETNSLAGFLNELENIIRRRRAADPAGSYTARLLTGPVGKIAQKVGEEAVETVIEALGDNRERLLNETADLLYHLLVLLAAKDIRLSEVEQILESRHRH
ncbi:MAG: bifunctional phosphoribosyl-AMP cyclohydrolase/phosphoribosyl-ATP diphosphatase HisIE [Thermoanaerobaculia bacterium]|nr:bifunctional phosphoribosyl-AMP cyclohydrolase/phosphoribosyl-ATP diphosphatase HisIE [Thermoanaerobaculia bacterium]